MPIKVNLTQHAPESKNNFTEKRRRDRMGADKYYSDEYKRSPKTDREPSPRSAKSDRIYDTPEFKKAVKRTESDFSSRSFSILKRLDGSSVPRR